MKNRIIALTLCAGMLLLGGCASDTGTNDNTSEPTAGSTPSSVETEAPSEESGEPISEPENLVEVNEPEGITGIIAMTSNIGASFSFNVFSINPETGERTTLASLAFPSEGADERRAVFGIGIVFEVYRKNYARADARLRCAFNEHKAVHPSEHPLRKIGVHIVDYL